MLRSARDGQAQPHAHSGIRNVCRPFALPRHFPFSFPNSTFHHKPPTISKSVSELQLLCLSHTQLTKGIREDRAVIVDFLAVDANFCRHGVFVCVPAVRPGLLVLGIGAKSKGTEQWLVFVFCCGFVTRGLHFPIKIINKLPPI
jgi:hypothetical protein